MLEPGEELGCHVFGELPENFEIEAELEFAFSDEPHIPTYNLVLERGKGCVFRKNVFFTRFSPFSC